MKFILFCEGETEAKALPPFLKKWLDPRLQRPAGITPVNFKGWPQLVKDAPTKARMYLNAPDKEKIIAVIALLDLYGPKFYPSNITTAAQRYNWAKEYLEKAVALPKFKQFLAVHETEAWLLSDPNLFPHEIKSALPGKVQHPEEVNFDEPPARLLDRIYQQKTKRSYKKTTHSIGLLEKLYPNLAYSKCPKLKELLDEMLNLAKAAGL
ncbi:DUF4276 family protein [candidate division KSB1 bacterium]|nr:DUF4276 family protein [candidate division KSB1 bacterium]